MTEILAPAGDKQTALTALDSGADAIYLGLSEFSARGSAENFRLDELNKITAYAHLLGARVYVCLNTLIKDSETDAFFARACEAWDAGADAILLQDLFLGEALKRAYPEMELHLSTQAGVCNVYGARLAKEYGFSRVVLARETPLEEIALISKIIETEVFVQGALCTCFSGQCYFSSFAGNNSGNRGHCKQPCRKKYSIDRAGFTSPAYALSLSDLSVGERVSELIEAGVSSLKIEGRLRRPEYVSAAVSYYRGILNGKADPEEFSRLKRAYNRGDYTAGLTFGQDKRFLSRDVQGHIGERIGEITLRGGKYFCFGVARNGDGFKILRGGKEVGGAVFSGEGKDGFFLSSSQKLYAGDEVRITTDTAPHEILPKRREITLSLRFVAGEKPFVKCGDLEYVGSAPLEQAKNAPLSKEELAVCFEKTDALPFSVRFDDIITENAFLPKSALNGIRREFYAALAAHLAPAREPLREARFRAEISPCKEDKTAVLATELSDLKADILILKPHDYAAISSGALSGIGEKYLYLPPFFTSEDEKCIEKVISAFDGIYCDGYYGIALAEKYQKPLFAGTGFNLTNRFALRGLKKAGAKYIALSKEIDSNEQRALAEEGVFALSLGGVKVMDLCYCPFGRACAACDQKETYTLTDEAGRRFPLRRYRLSGACRFEVYNCAPLAAFNGMTGAIVDLSTEKDVQLVALARDKNAFTHLKNSTKGHSERSML